jgi:5-methylcytosine-specific restriction endonuclease McrA
MSERNRNQYKNKWRCKQGREYIQSQNEKVKAYQSTFFGQLALRASWINRGAKVRGANGKVTAGDLVNLLAKQNGWNESCRCALCGHLAGKDLMQLDHIMPIALGGLNEIENMQFLCADCHVVKTTNERKHIAEYNTVELQQELAI